MSGSTVATLTLQNLTADFTSFRTQLQAIAAANSQWAGEYTSSTSQTIIDLIAATGTYAVGAVLRTKEDAFSETAQSDEAIRAIALMQGIRLGRKSPAITANVTINSPGAVTIPAYSQFTCGGVPLFNRAAINFTAAGSKTVDLYEGTVVQYTVNGLGTPRQTFLSPEDGFYIADSDVVVTVDGSIIPRTLGTLWNYRGAPAFADLTTSDGRMLLVFGNATFGSMPTPANTVNITYVTTKGASANGTVLANKNVNCATIPSLSGTCSSNLTGGSAQQSVLAYKNLGSSSFGNYESAVTPAQYRATVSNYSGVVDAIVQAQRDIDTTQLKWMNVMRVSAITSSPWTTAQKNAYFAYLQSVCMYQPYFIWNDPVAVIQNVDFDVYCNNASVLTTVKANCIAAVTELFAARSGILNLNLYRSDIEKACRDANPGLISYFIFRLPTTDSMICYDGSPTAVISYNTLGSLTVNALYTARKEVT